MERLAPGAGARETWDFRRYESDPAIDALAEQMGVHPEDVTPETILGYVEEVRAAGVATTRSRVVGKRDPNSLDGYKGAVFDRVITARAALLR